MKNWSNLLISICLISINSVGKAQNERFRGGNGDGFSLSGTVVNMGQIGESVKVEVDYAVGQSALTNTGVVQFVVRFSIAPLAFNDNDLVFSGAASPGLIQISGSGIEYIVTLSNFNSEGNIILSVPPHAVQDVNGNDNLASIAINDEVIVDSNGPTVAITLGILQKSRTRLEQIEFVATFSEQVTSLKAEDIVFSGTANPNNLVVQGQGSAYSIIVSGMSQEGTVSIIIPAGIVRDMAGNLNSSSNNIANQVFYDFTGPTVEIKLAEGQVDPTYILPLKFSVKFSEEVVDFSQQSISYGGSSSLTMNISGTGTEYTVAINGASTNETVSIYVSEGIVHDIAENTNAASVNIDNSITYLGTTGVEKVSKKPEINVYYSSGNIVVDFEKPLQNNVLLEVFDILGQNLTKRELSDMLSYIRVKSSSCYLIRLSNASFIYSKKIIAD